MPVTPAMNVLTTKETIRNSTISQSEIIFLNKVNDFIKKVDVPKHLILFLIIYYLFYFRLIRGFILNSISWDGTARIPYVRFPLLCMRGMWLIGTSFAWYGFWLKISDKLNWNWDLPYTS